MRRTILLVCVLSVAFGTVVSAELTPEQTKQAKALIKQFSARQLRSG